MKHIKRKTLLEMNIPQEAIENLPTSPSELKAALKNLKYKDVKGKHALLILESGEVMRSFFVNDNGRACSIPIANPVLIYFNFAQSLLNNLSQTKERLLNVFDGDDEVTEDSLKLFYEYFGLTSSFVTMLMTSIECFVNQKLNPLASYSKNEGSKFKRVYDYDQIQRWVPLSEKIDCVLAEQTGKNFKRTYPIKYQHFDNLKTLRDLIVHTKAGGSSGVYVELFKKSLCFNFNDTIQSIKDFINFYEENLVEPCPCGVDS